MEEPASHIGVKLKKGNFDLDVEKLKGLLVEVKD